MSLEKANNFKSSLAVSMLSCSLSYLPSAPQVSRGNADQGRWKHLKAGGHEILGALSISKGYLQRALSKGTSQEERAFFQIKRALFQEKNGTFPRKKGHILVL